jgi:hypothetical protein
MLGEDGDVADVGAEGSGMMSLESICVGGLFSSRERLIHHDPGRGALRSPPLSAI